MIVENMIREIFSPSAPINEPQLFAGRKDQLKRIENVILERGRHAALFGERGVGKTSLANIIKKESELKGIAVIYNTLSSEDNFASIWKKALRNIEFTVPIPHTTMGFGKEGETTKISLADRYGDKITSDEILRDMQQINCRLVLIFDEFDKVINEDAKTLMAHTMKLFSDTGVNVTIILVGVSSDINTLITAHESIKRNLEEIKMPRMSDEELIEILDISFQKISFEIEPTAKAKIIRLSTGLPEYVHSIGRDAALSAALDQRSKILESDVDSAISEFVKKSDQSSREAYNKAISSNRVESLYADVLLSCTQAKADEEGRFQQKDVVEPLAQIVKRNIPIAGFQSHIAAFCSVERGSIIEKFGKARSYKYRFKEPRLQIYTMMKGILSGKIS